jgi:transketolase
MREAFVDSLISEARKNEKIILITGDLGFGVLEKFQREFPNQFINAGVAEQTMMGLAAGIASTGKRVFVYSIANFPTFRCLEQIRNDICYMNNPVVVVSVGAGYAYGSQGYTHHAIEDIAALRSLPNMDIVVPADPSEAKVLTSELAKGVRPSYLRLGKSNEPDIHVVSPGLTYGKFVKIASGDKGSILFTGSIGVVALEAHAQLQALGVRVSLFSVPYLTNLDDTQLALIAKHGPVVTVEEHSYRGGLGSAILERFARLRIRADVRLIASDQNNLSQIGDQEFLRKVNGISATSIIKEFLEYRTQ